MANDIAATPQPTPKAPTPPPPGSRWEEIIYVFITVVLGIIAVTTIFGALWLTAHGISPIPESVIALGSTATGALAGVLVPRPSTASAP